MPAAFAAVFESYPRRAVGEPSTFRRGRSRVSEWTFTGTRRDGTRVEVAGCDLLTFRDGRIAIKDSYRKNRLVG